MRRTSFLTLAAVVLLVSTSFLAGCGATATPTAAPTKAATVAATTAPAAAATTAATKAPTTAPTAVPPTATKAPTVGGTLVYGLETEPPTLDAHKNILIVTAQVGQVMAGCLIGRDPATGNFVPAIAESWTASDDALTWTFKIKKGVKFHDGNPVTAKDWVWTFERAKDPATKNPSSGFKYIKGVSAPDEYTFVITMVEPYAPLLHSLMTNSFQVLSKAAVEKGGDQYGRAPVGAGPFKFKEWQTGQKIVVERFADYNWGPTFLHSGAAYLQTIEFRIIPEYSTILAGLESGEIDMAVLQTKDVARVKALNKFQFNVALNQGMNPVLLLNCAQPPFDDVKVRKAVNYAMDRQAMIKAVALGEAVEMHGPLSPSQPGYWPDIEKMGYGYDLAQAKALMKEAGYTTGANGMLEKNGQQLKITLKTEAFWSQVTTMIQDMFKQLGIQATIQEMEGNAHYTEILAGKYDASLYGISSAEPDLMYGVLHSKQIGVLNFSQVKDPALDKLLEAQRSASDWSKRQVALQEVQKAIVERAIFCPLYAPKTYIALSNRIKGTVYCQTYCPVVYTTYYLDAYVEAK
jgi:peptide/nickel transport system substrate-binding protein